MSTVIIVDNMDRVLGHKLRRDRVPTDIIRATGLWVYKIGSVKNGEAPKEVLIARRSMNKPYDKGKWGPSAAGTLELGETYESNVVKEAGEEIGLKINPRQLIKGKYGLIQSTQRYFYQGFIYGVAREMVENDFVLQEDEVDEVRFMEIGKLLKWVKERPGDFIESFGCGLNDSTRSTLGDICEYLRGI